AQLVAGVHRGAPPIGEPAARLRTGPRPNPGARPPDPRALRSDGALRGLDRDPQPHRRFAPRAAQQLRALAALREAGRVDRAGPRLPARLLKGTPSGDREPRGRARNKNMNERAEPGSARRSCRTISVPWTPGRLPPI